MIQLYYYMNEAIIDSGEFTCTLQVVYWVRPRRVHTIVLNFIGLFYISWLLWSNKSFLLLSLKYKSNIQYFLQNYFKITKFKVSGINLTGITIHAIHVNK